MNKKDDFGAKGNFKRRKDDETVFIKYIPLPSDRSLVYSYGSSRLFSKYSKQSRNTQKDLELQFIDINKPYEPFKNPPNQGI